MNCPKCDSEASGVVDSRTKEPGKWRRRECVSCGHRWNTYEVEEHAVTQYAMVRAALQEIQRLTKPYAES